MAFGLVGLYGLFLVFVGINGNAGQLIHEIKTDVVGSTPEKGFAAWAIAIIVLAALYRVDAIKPVIKPFIALAILTFVLKNYGVVVSQINEITGLNLPGATSEPQTSGANGAEISQ